MENPCSEKIDFSVEIWNLKRDKNAIILAHYYQIPEIQDAADFIGDSLKLSQEAEKTNASIIVFAGVHFMAETAKILNSNKKVLLPDINAGCSLSESCPPEKFRQFLSQNPEHIVVTYINCSAEIKAMSDIVCTSSNAVQVINSIPKEKKIIFAPDKNLGKYLIKKTDREMLLWEGECMVHAGFSIDKLLSLHRQHPNAKIIAHPESEEHILKVANFIGSTSQLLNFVKNDSAEEYLVGTEAGILYQMFKACPQKKIIPIPVYEDNTCACSECGFMKVNTIEKLYQCLKNEKPEIKIPEAIMEKAYFPIKRMLEINAS